MVITIKMAYLRRKRHSFTRFYLFNVIQLFDSLSLSSTIDGVNDDKTADGC
jgi:hypothetical protein